eukprot:657661-Pyramimonas_sp.AAC.1
MGGPATRPISAQHPHPDPLPKRIRRWRRSTEQSAGGPADQAVAERPGSPIGLPQNVPRTCC